MTRSAWCRIAIVITGLGVMAASPAHAQRRPISEKDLFKFVWVADPQISPDGSQVAFVRVDGRREEGRVRDVDLDGEDAMAARRRGAFTSGIRDTSAALVARRPAAGVRPRGREGRPAAAAADPRDGDGRRRAAGDHRHPARRRRVRSGRPTARRSRSPRAHARRAADELAAKPAGDKPRESDVRVITEAVYRANGVAGSGYVDRDRPSHIWTVAVPAGRRRPARRRRQLTSGEFGAGNHQWSPDGRSIYFVSDRRREPYYYPRRQRSLRASPKTAASRRGSRASTATSARTRSPATASASRSSARRPARRSGRTTQPDLWVADLAGGAPRNLTPSYDFDIDGGARRRSAGAARPAARRPGLEPRRPHASSIAVGEQGNADLDARRRRDRASVDRAHARQTTTSWRTPPTPPGSRFAAVLSTPTVVGDLHVLDGSAPARAEEAHRLQRRAVRRSWR